MQSIINSTLENLFSLGAVMVRVSAKKGDFRKGNI